MILQAVAKGVKIYLSILPVAGFAAPPVTGVGPVEPGLYLGASVPRHQHHRVQPPATTWQPWELTLCSLEVISWITGSIIPV